MKPITTKLAGVTYDDAQRNIRNLNLQHIRAFDLVRQPDNKHDRNAIRVVYQGTHLGFIPKEISKYLAPRIDLGGQYEARPIRKNTSPHHEIVGLTIEIVEVTPVPQQLLYLCSVEHEYV